MFHLYGIGRKDSLRLSKIRKACWVYFSPFSLHHWVLRCREVELLLQTVCRRLCLQTVFFVSINWLCSKPLPQIGGINMNVWGGHLFTATALFLFIGIAEGVALVFFFFVLSLCWEPFSLKIKSLFELCQVDYSLLSEHAGYLLLFTLTSISYSKGWDTWMCFFRELT